jgi:hypothetical protein
MAVFGIRSVGHPPQKNLAHSWETAAPSQALKERHKKRPERFKKPVYNLRQLDAFPA